MTDGRPNADPAALQRHESDAPPSTPAPPSPTAPPPTAPAAGAEPAHERPGRAERRARAYAREHGVSRPLYAFVRFVALVVLRGWFRLYVAGAAQIPTSGAAIIAPNHKNTLDAFFIGIATRRQIRYMAKVELFRGPLAWLLPRVGAFPVRRGEADHDARETARTILRGGGVVVMFPEGRVLRETDRLAAPHHGAGTLALETGSPVIPAAITGTSCLWRARLPKVRRVQLSFLAAIAPDATAGDDAVSELIEEQVWPAVQQEYDRLTAPATS